MVSLFVPSMFHLCSIFFPSVSMYFSIYFPYMFHIFAIVFHLFSKVFHGFPQFFPTFSTVFPTFCPLPQGFRPAPRLSASDSPRNPRFVAGAPRGAASPVAASRRWARLRLWHLDRGDFLFIVISISSLYYQHK